MELRTLQYFLAVVREGNITRAAEVLHLTQPALSRQINQLEVEVGTPLLVRGKYLTLTDAGIFLSRRAEEILYLMERTQKELQEQNEISGVIRIGVGGQFSLSGIPNLIQEFVGIHPKVQFDFCTDHAGKIKERLDHGLLDIGLLLEPVDVSRYETIRIKRRVRWGLLVRSDNLLAAKTVIEKDDLLHIPLMVSSRADIQRELSNWLGTDITRLDIIATYDVVTNVAMMVDYGVASALTIESAVNLFDKERFLFRPLSPQLSDASVLAWKRSNPSLGVANSFIEFVRSRTVAADFEDQS